MSDRKNLLTPSSSAHLIPLTLLFICTTWFLFPVSTAIETSPFGSSSDPPYTVQQCNFTAFPKNGCEDDLGTECLGEGTSARCRCKPGHSHLVDGRFCFRVACPPGHYHDAYENRCLAQRRASSQVAESHCRYDYHCYGPHVRCVLYGWNRNCVCSPGFTYGYNGTCIPLFGIGGHCAADGDCDQTGTRKMFCQPTTGVGEGAAAAASGDGSQIGSSSSSGSGTCQCMAEHTYNYQVDGCESNERIRERRNNMRTLILLFVLCATVFGFALTFNFGLFGSPSRAQQAMLLKRLALEKERAAREAEEGGGGRGRADGAAAGSSSSGGGGGDRTSSPSAPPGDGGLLCHPEAEIMFHKADDGTKKKTTNSILVVDLDMVDADDVEKEEKGGSGGTADNSKPSNRLISLY